MCPIRQHRVGLPESTIDLVPTFWVPEILATKGNEPQLRFHRVDICRFDLFRIWPEVLRTDNGVYFCFPSSCLYLLVRQPESKFANVIKGWFLGHYRYPNRMRLVQSRRYPKLDERGASGSLVLFISRCSGTVGCSGG